MKRVLVVDDEPTIRELVAEALREAGYWVDTAAHGAEALQLMHAGPPPHAIVLDLMMPRLDGTGFVELMRLNPRLACVPVVLVTAAYGAPMAAERMGDFSDLLPKTRAATTLPSRRITMPVWYDDVDLSGSVGAGVPKSMKGLAIPSFPQLHQAINAVTAMQKPLIVRRMY